MEELRHCTASFCAQTPGACGVCIDVDLTVIDVVAAVRVQYDKAVGGGPARAVV